jgi:hypothetical protein
MPRRKAKAAAKTKAPKPAPARHLARAALRDLRANWVPYVLIMAVVTVPLNLSALLTISDNGALSAYFSLAVVVMNVALIYAIVKGQQTRTVPKVRAAYYEGSVALVRFTIVNLLIVLMLAPASIGLLLYGYALLSSQFNGTGAADTIPVGFVALLLAMVSFYLLVRYILASMIVVSEELAPVAALRKSRYVTLGRFWPVAARLVLLGIFLIIISIPSTLIAWGLAAVNQPTWGIILFGILTAFLAVPFTNLYLLGLYHNLANNLRAPLDADPATTGDAPHHG